MLIAVTGAALCWGCAGTVKQTELPEKPDVSFVFLFIDMTDAPTEIGDAEIRQVDPPTDEPFFWMRVHDGVVYREHIANGSYALSWFSSGSGWHFFSNPTEYRVPVQGNAARFTIEQPGVYFVGAFAYRDEGGGFFTPEKFSLVPIDRITEKEALARILPYVVGTPWEARVKAYAAGLR